jgi:hypothetical protein
MSVLYIWVPFVAPVQTGAQKDPEIAIAFWMPSFDGMTEIFLNPSSFFS